MESDQRRGESEKTTGEDLTLFYAQRVIKEEPKIEDLKTEPVDCIKSAAYEQSIVKEEIEIDDFISESVHLTTTTYGQFKVKKELNIENLKEEPDLHEKTHENEKENRFNNSGCSDDATVVDPLDFTDDDTLKISKNITGRSNGSLSRKCTVNSSKFAKTSIVQNPKESALDSIEASTSKTFSTTVVNDLDTAYEKFASTYCSKCKKHQPTIYRRARCSKCRTNLRYDCQTCHMTYKTFTDLGRHLKCKHVLTVITHNNLQESVITHNCDNCDKTFDLLKRFNEHRRGCTGESSYPCQQCSYVAKFKSNLTSHVKSAHKHFEVNCPNCDKLYTNERSYKRHLKVYCGKRKLIGCHHCSAKVYRKEQILDHLKYKHPRVFKR